MKTHLTQKKQPAATKKLTSDFYTIDIRRWQQEGLLRPGFSFTRVWNQAGRPLAQLRVRPLGDRLELAYSVASNNGFELAWEGTISVAHSPCHLGGERPWFLCPQEGCRRRVALLYERGGFACRQCRELAYPSQREGVSDRALRKADRIRQRLGWEPWECSAFGSRPKGMHNLTFGRLQAQRARLMIQALGGAKAKLNATLRRLDAQPAQ